MDIMKEARGGTTRHFRRPGRGKMKRKIRWVMSWSPNGSQDVESLINPGFVKLIRQKQQLGKASQRN